MQNIGTNHRLKKILAGSAVALLSLPGCVSIPRPHEPIYETTYDCSVTETHGSLRLAAEPDNVRWSEKIDGVETQAYLQFADDSERSRFLASGFDNFHFDHPILFFDYPDGMTPDSTNSYTVMGKPLTNVFGGARSGDETIQQHAAVNVFLSLNWKQMRRLTRNGSTNVSLYGVDGKIYWTRSISRSHLDEIEAALKAIFAQVVARESDKEHFCTGETHEVEQEVIMVN